MRRVKGLLKACFLVMLSIFLLASVINQKYCRPITRTVLMHEDSTILDVFALENIKAKEKVYNDLITYSEALKNSNKSEMNKVKTMLSYLDIISNYDMEYCYLNNELFVKSILDNEYKRILNNETKANTQYFPVEELYRISKSKEYLLLLSKILYYSFIIMIIFGWSLVGLKFIEVIINWRKKDD